GGQGRLLHSLLWYGIRQRAGAQSDGQAREEERDPEQSASGGEGGDLEPRDGLLRLPRRDAGRGARDAAVRARQPTGNPFGGAVLLRGLPAYADGAQSGEVR